MDLSTLRRKIVGVLIICSIPLQLFLLMNPVLYIFREFYIRNINHFGPIRDHSIENLLAFHIASMAFAITIIIFICFVIYLIFCNLYCAKLQLTKNRWEEAIL